MKLCKLPSSACTSVFYKLDFSLLVQVLPLFYLYIFICPWLLKQILCVWGTRPFARIFISLSKLTKLLQIFQAIYCSWIKLVSNECVCLFLFFKCTYVHCRLNLYGISLWIHRLALWLVMDVKRLSQGTTAVGVSCETTISRLKK